MQKVFILDDEKAITELLTEHLRDNGIPVDAFYNAEAALAKACSGTDVYAYYFIDYHIGGFDGFEFCKILHYDHGIPADNLVIMTGDCDVAFMLNDKPMKTLYKPFDLSALTHQIQQQFDKYKDLV